MLTDFRGRSLVLAFYPADWSPVCTSELALFQEVIDEIHGRSAELVGVSVDSMWSHRAWARSQGLTFPLLSDFWPHGAMAARYGLFRPPEGCTERALVFIDGQGVVRRVWVAERLDIAPGLDLVFDGLDELAGKGKGGEAHV